MKVFHFAALNAHDAYVLTKNINFKKINKRQAGRKATVGKLKVKLKKMLQIVIGSPSH